MGQKSEMFYFKGAKWEIREQQKWILEDKWTNLKPSNKTRSKTFKTENELHNNG